MYGKFALAFVLVSRLGSGANAQSVAAPGANALADAVARYAQFGAARPLSDTDRRRIVDDESADLAQHPADAAADRRIAAFLASVANLRGPAREAARTAAWNASVAASHAENGRLDPVTATVLRYNPVVASDPRTGIAVSMHALQGYASSIDLTARLGGRPALGNVDANRIAPALAATFSTYSPETQRMVATGAERWIALKERIDSASAGSLSALRSKLAAGTLTRADVARSSQTLETRAMRETFDQVSEQTRAIFAAGAAAFGSGHTVWP